MYKITVLVLVIILGFSRKRISKEDDVFFLSLQLALFPRITGSKDRQSLHLPHTEKDNEKGKKRSYRGFVSWRGNLRGEARVETKMPFSLFEKTQNFANFRIFWRNLFFVKTEIFADQFPYVLPIFSRKLVRKCPVQSQVEPIPMAGKERGFHYLFVVPCQDQSGSSGPEMFHHLQDARREVPQSWDCT